MEVRKYDLNDQYLHCRKNQLVSYLDYKKIPVDLLFYNALERSMDVYDSVFANRMDRNHYLDKAAPEETLNLLGVTSTHYTMTDFEQLQPEIENGLRTHDIVFVYGNGRFLDYKLDSYQTKDILHSLAIFKMEQENEGVSYHIFDDIYDGPTYMSGRDYVHYKVSDKVAREFFINQRDDEGVNLLAKERMTVLDFHPVDQQTALAAIQENYAKWLADYDDGFELYKLIPSLVQDESVIGSFNTKEDFFEAITQVITLLIGSKKHFIRFLQYTNSSPELITMLEDSISSMEGVRFVLNKIRFSGRVDLVKLTQKSDLAFNKEQQFLQALRSHTNLNLLTL